MREGVGEGEGRGRGWGFKMETHSKPMISVCTFLCSSITRLCEGAAGSSSSGLGFFLLLLLLPSIVRVCSKCLCVWVVRSGIAELCSVLAT